MGTTEREDGELARAQSKLAAGDYKGAFKALDNARYTGDQRVLGESARLLREVASRSSDQKIAQKASELAGTVERSMRDAEARAGAAAAARQQAEAVEAAKRYKVLTQKDSFFAGQFDPDKLEAAVNAYAEQGWRVISMVTASVPFGLNQHRDEIIILLTREPGAG
jgi:Domain of unknown function (DUF4177)